RGRHAKPLSDGRGKYDIVYNSENCESIYTLKEVSPLRSAEVRVFVFIVIFEASDANAVVGPSGLLCSNSQLPGLTFFFPFSFFFPFFFFFFPSFSFLFFFLFFFPFSLNRSCLTHT